MGRARSVSRSGASGPGDSGPGDSANSRLTLVFTKRPVPGRVKTRLSPPLTPEEAARLADGMLRDAVERCQGAADRFRTALCYAPPEEGEWFRRAFPGLPDLRAQRGPGLGPRLAHAFRHALRDPGVRTVVAIGSDQPLVGSGRVTEAHRALEEGADLVVGPDRSGGYYLIGLRAPHIELFTEVEMSTAGMCAATCRLAEERGLFVRLLAPADDVDRADDLARVRAELAEWRARGGADEAEFPRHTEASLREISFVP